MATRPWSRWFWYCFGGWLCVLLLALFGEHTWLAELLFGGFAWLYLGVHATLHLAALVTGGLTLVFGSGLERSAAALPVVGLGFYALLWLSGPG